MLEEIELFVKEDNSSNLPFYIIKDEYNNDVIYINDNNKIYMNDVNTNISEQIFMYKNLYKLGICSISKVNKDLYIVKQYDNKIINWSLLNKDGNINIYSNLLNNKEEINFYFNDKYLCLTTCEYGEYLPNIMVGYDIKENKFLDCDDYKTTQYLRKYLVEYRSYRYEFICSVLNNAIPKEHYDLLYNFLGFILDKDINENNLEESRLEGINYILDKYPIFNSLIQDDNVNLDLKKKFLKQNYIYLNRKSNGIENLKYLNKVYVKKA